MATVHSLGFVGSPDRYRMAQARPNDMILVTVKFPHRQDRSNPDPEGGTLSIRRNTFSPRTGLPEQARALSDRGSL